MRSHVENILHWVLDVTLREDDSRIRKDHAPENMAMVRHIILNMLQNTKKKFKAMSISVFKKKLAGEKSWLGDSMRTISRAAYSLFRSTKTFE